MESRRRGKRKSPAQDIIFEVSDGDVSSENTDNEYTEPEAKISKTEGNDFSSKLQNDDSNLECGDISSTNSYQSQKEHPDNNEVLENISDVNTIIDLTDSTQDTLDMGIKNFDRNKKIILDVSKYNCSETIIEISDNNLEDGEFEETLNLSDMSQNETKKEINPIKLDSLTDQVCSVNTDSYNEQVDCSKANSCICITFGDENIAELYKLKFLKFVQTFIELHVENYDGLSINIHRDSLLNPNEWVVLDETMCLSEINKIKEEEELAVPLPPSPERCPKKKKKKKAKKDRDMFILDTTPSNNENTEINMMYSTKFQIDINDKNTNDEELRVSSQTCFNCDSNHALKDCPFPRDFARINNARQKFKLQKQTSRYHLEEDQKYSHLVPGKISGKLRDALGLRKNQMPFFFYQMRILGYPPGWLEEAKCLHSNLTMFDTDGNNVRGSSLKKKQGLDPHKIIEYPGFNIPFERGIKDESRQYHVPHFSQDYCKERMIDFFEKQYANQQDDLETCDMDLDSNFEDNKDKFCKSAIPTKIINPEVSDLKNIDSNIPSPSLRELENQKESLLAALEDNSSCNTKSDDNVCDEKLINIKKCNSKSTTIVKLSKSADEPQYDVPHDKNLSIDIEKAQLVNSSSELSPPLRSVNTVKTSSFGTPILKSSSPYSQLPNPDNFMKDVSPVINFENLPNSTGKYEQMTGVLQKVRNTLKNLQNCKL